MQKQVPKPAAKKVANPAAKRKAGYAYGAATLKLGDLVKIRHHAGIRGKVVELRGPLGPGGAQIYRVMLRRKPHREYVEVREDQLISVPAQT